MTPGLVALVLASVVLVTWSAMGDPPTRLEVLDAGRSGVELLLSALSSSSPSVSSESLAGLLGSYSTVLYAHADGTYFLKNATLRVILSSLFCAVTIVPLMFMIFHALGSNGSRNLLPGWWSFINTWSPVFSWLGRALWLLLVWSLCLVRLVSALFVGSCIASHDGVGE